MNAIIVLLGVVLLCFALLAYIIGVKKEEVIFRPIHLAVILLAGMIIGECSILYFGDSIGTMFLLGAFVSIVAIYKIGVICRPYHLLRLGRAKLVPK